MTDEYDEYGVGGTSPTGEDKHNIHTFLHNVAVAPDTTKTGNLTIEELGMPKLPFRTYKELSLFCNDIMDQPDFAEYFKKKGEILTATSLSKEAALLKFAVTQKREVADLTSKPKENKGWFNKKDKNQPDPNKLP